MAAYLRTKLAFIDISSFLSNIVFLNTTIHWLFMSYAALDCKKPQALT